MINRKRFIFWMCFDALWTFAFAGLGVALLGDLRLIFGIAFLFLSLNRAGEMMKTLANHFYE